MRMRETEPEQAAAPGAPAPSPDRGENLSEDRMLEARLRAVFPQGVTGLIFDCDGVLVDSKDANIGYYNRLLAEFGRPPMPESFVDYVQMASVNQAFELLFTPEELRQLPAITQRVPYSTVSLPLLRLEEGVRDLLERLRERNIRLAVHTNRGSGVWDVLDMFSLRGFFDPVMTVEDVAPKPDPQGVRRILAAWGARAGEVGFVGDSATDAGAAAGAGVPLLAYRNPALTAAVHVDDFTRLDGALAALKAAPGFIPDSVPGSDPDRQPEPAPHGSPRHGRAATGLKP